MVIAFPPRLASSGRQPSALNGVRASAVVVALPTRRTLTQPLRSKQSAHLQPGMPEYEAIVQQAIERAEKRGW